MGVGVVREHGEYVGKERKINALYIVILSAKTWSG